MYIFVLQLHQAPFIQDELESALYGAGREQLLFHPPCLQFLVSDFNEQREQSLNTPNNTDNQSTILHRTPSVCRKVLRVRTSEKIWC